MALDKGDFFKRVDELKEEIGTGPLTGSLEIDQHYALDQHENFNYEHPRGGGPKYLIGPLMKYTAFYLENLAMTISDGESPVQPMIENMEHLSTLMDPAAPIDEDPNPIRLRRSGQPRVHDNGKLVYHRPPRDPREPFGIDEFTGKNEDELYDEDGFKLGFDYPDPDPPEN